MPRPGLALSAAIAASIAAAVMCTPTPAAPPPAPGTTTPATATVLLAPLAEGVKIDKTVTPATTQAVRKLVYGMNPKAEVKQIVESPFPGVKTVVADQSVIYVSNDGRYFMYGILVDTRRGENLTDGILGKLRVKSLASIPAHDIISIKPAKTKYVVTVFTDTSCPYCTALHRNEAGYLQAGIQINYVPWPRAGMTAPNVAQMQSVWCAPDRAKAYADAMSGKIAANTPVGTCTAAKDFPKLFDLGLKLGIEGTPAIFDSTGRKLGGFLPPDQLLAKLQDLDRAKVNGNAVAEK